MKMGWMKPKPVVKEIDEDEVPTYFDLWVNDGQVGSNLKKRCRSIFIRLSSSVSHSRCTLYVFSVVFELYSDWSVLEIFRSKRLLGCYCHPDYVCYLVSFMVHANLIWLSFLC